MFQHFRADHQIGIPVGYGDGVTFRDYALHFTRGNIFKPLFQGAYFSFLHVNESDIGAHFGAEAGVAAIAATDVNYVHARLDEDIGNDFAGLVITPATHCSIKQAGFDRTRFDVAGIHGKSPQIVAR